MFTKALVVAFLAVAAHAQCVGTISSLTDVAAAVACTTINVNGFTVPAGETFTLSLLAGTTVNIWGDIVFGEKEWAGPLFSISGSDITFEGNGHTFNGNGQFYWDGKGASSGATEKPRPMMKVKTSGTFSNLTILNSPAQTFSIDNAAPLTISDITIDDSLGDLPNSMSGGLPAGANTDGFDVGNQAPVTIQGWKNSTVKNQDDCIAINSGVGVVFTGNHCSGGHGISIVNLLCILVLVYPSSLRRVSSSSLYPELLRDTPANPSVSLFFSLHGMLNTSQGSVDTGDVVANITISNNVVTSGANGLRIKTIATATSGNVSNISYSNNEVSGVTEFGLLIDQSYPSTLGTPGNGIIISSINFIGTNTLTMAGNVTPIAVNCGSGSCQGEWNWSGLKVSGGAADKINYSGITGFTADERCD
ncbi:pectin lyase fold/virulence factor [Mycena galopus ATCC 62051]|nr:pectin lyase fold/virulence factor [Mycena galopus ATCC 62051]